MALAQPDVDLLDCVSFPMSPCDPKIFSPLPSANQFHRFKSMLANGMFAPGSFFFSVFQKVLREYGNGLQKHLHLTRISKYD